MLWIFAIAGTLALVILGNRVGGTDDVHSVALYVTALIISLLGLIIAPIEVQLTLSLLTLGGAFTLGRRASSLRN